MFLKNPLKLWKWTFENDVFQISANFWVTKWKPLSGKARQSVESCLNQNLVIWSISENHFKAILRSKRNVLYLMVFLSFFANFWVTKLKLLSGKPRQSVENYSNPNLVIGSFLENDFEATLRWKTIFLRVWKWYFSLFWIFLSNEVESVFWESEGKRSKLFESKFGLSKNFRK